MSEDRTGSIVPQPQHLLDHMLENPTIIFQLSDADLGSSTVL